MTARLYLAARYSRRLELVGYRAVLQAMGFVVTSRWLDGEHQYGPGTRLVQEQLQSDLDLAARFAIEDAEDVADATVLVSFTEPPRQPSTNRGGRHVEFGLALGLGRMDLVVIGPRENAFHYLPQVIHYDTWQDALDAYFTDATT